MAPGCDDGVVLRAQARDVPRAGGLTTLKWCAIMISLR
jgi:hypothetical protein